MDWWTSSASASAAAAVSASAAAAVVANELGGGPTGAGSGAGGQQIESSNGFFDPWLNVNCDELDLSIILSQHSHQHHAPAHLTTTFCDVSTNNHHNKIPPSLSPHQRTSSMINGDNNSNYKNDDFSSNNNSAQSTTTCSPTNNNSKLDFAPDIAGRYLQSSSVKNNGPLTAAPSSSSSSTTTTCSSSPNHATTTCGNNNSNQVHNDNSTLCTAVQSQELVLANSCSTNNNSFDVTDKLRFSLSSNREDCKSLASSFANRQQTAQHNSFFDHILNTHNSTSSISSSQQSAISKQSMQTTSNYSSCSRTLVTDTNTNNSANKIHNNQHLLQQQQQQQQNQQISYLSCSSAASPITSSSVSSSIELSPHNSAEISSNGTPAHACYPLGTSYRFNVLSPISPTSLSICGTQTIDPVDQQHRSNSLPLLQNLGGGFIDHHQCDYRRLSDGHTKSIDQSHHINASQSRYIDSYSDDQVSSLLRKSNIVDEVPPLFDTNRCHTDRCDSLMGNDGDGCRCVVIKNYDDRPCGDGSRQRIRNNLENLLQLASGADGSPMSIGRDCNTDCKRLTAVSRPVADQSANQHVPVMKQNKQLQAQQSPSTSALQLHNNDGKYGDSSKETGSHSEKIARTTSNSNPQQAPDNNRIKTTGAPKGSRLRRCRHITDYVLAEEEKRLLIKEGYTDFPMVSSPTRPLSRAEERILRKIRRKIRNKKSAQCSRQRKKEYVEELERKYTMVVRENEELKQLLNRIQQHANQG